jgi:hypothetical protein
MAEAKRKRRSPAEAETLKELQQRRQELDAEAAERRRREDEALAMYAAAEARRAGIRDDEQRQLDDLVARQAKVRERAGRQMEAVDSEQGAALLSMKELGRSGPELSRLTGLPVKRVRAMLAAAQSSRGMTAFPERGSRRATRAADADAAEGTEPSPVAEGSRTAEPASPQTPPTTATGTGEVG